MQMIADRQKPGIVVDRRALLKAPIVPTIIFVGLWSLVSVFLAGSLLRYRTPEGLAEALVADPALMLPLVFIVVYVTGILAALVLGCVVFPFVEEAVRPVGAFFLNELFRFALFGAVATILLSGFMGLSGQAMIFALACTLSYLNGLPRKRLSEMDAPEWAKKKPDAFWKAINKSQFIVPLAAQN